MDALVAFYASHGLGLTLAAIAGIILLGVMKYANVFAKLEEEIRHILYVCISVIFSILLAMLYMTMSDAEFEFTTITLFASNVFVLNQTFYNIFKVTTLQELLKKLFKKMENISK